MGIPIAWSETTTDFITTNGQTRIKLQQISKNYKAYSWAYKVDDEITVLINPETKLPIQLEVNISEGSKKVHYLTHFDHKNKIAITQDKITNTTTQVPIQKDTRDLYTFVYTLRNKTFDELTQTKYTLFIRGKLYQLEVKKHGKKSIQLPTYGKVSSIELEPLAQFDGFFLRKGKIFFWVSEADRRMITCIKTKVSVGKITVKLQSVSGPGDDFWAQD
jgi:hypothetical protein